jgi:hypothetical protein
MDLTAVTETCVDAPKAGAAAARDPGEGGIAESTQVDQVDRHIDV